MCGITGLVFQNGVKRNESVMGAIRFLFNELVVETQERGKDATGVLSMKRNGEYELYKAPSTAREITTNDENWANVIKAISNDNASLIAHTRWYTKGLPKNNKNNHPFEIGNILGVHNGTLTNDDALFKQFEFKREGEVDSEVIFHLINKYNTDAVTYSGLEQALEKSLLRGLFAIVFAHKAQPNLVHIVKQEKPMTLAYWKEAGLVLYNSQDDLIKNAFYTLKRAYRNMFGCDPEMTISYRDMENDTYLTIDANGQDLDSMISETSNIYILSSNTIRSGYYQGGVWVSSPASTPATTSDSCGTSGSTTRSITATDSIGRVIEGELDEISGEVIIYTTRNTRIDDDNDTPDGYESDEQLCIECSLDLDIDEIQAAFNANNPEHEKVCKGCYVEAMSSVLHG